MLEALLKRWCGAEKVTLPAAPDLVAFDQAYAQAEIIFRSEAFWGKAQKHIPPKIRDRISPELFYLGWERKVDKIILEAVRERIKGCTMPKLLEIAGGFSIGYNELHGAPWQSRRLVNGLGTENVLVTTYNNLAALAAYREARMPLNKSFESKLFGLEVMKGVDFHKLDYLGRGKFDIIYGRCLDPTTFSAAKFEAHAVEILNPGGIAIVEVERLIRTDIHIFDHHPTERRLSLRETR